MTSLSEQIKKSVDIFKQIVPYSIEFECQSCGNKGIDKEVKSYGESLTNAFRTAQIELLEKVREEIEKIKPKEFNFSSLVGSEHLSCEKGETFCRACNWGMMSETRRTTFSDLRSFLEKEIKKLRRHG